ncbi:hypothetical protein HDU84_007101 [Entophlyctis sp. JEL0112]|nr:hypothetical protein HDU84_007101 [Entophlyctis sp. JEL0112]
MASVNATTDTDTTPATDTPPSARQVPPEFALLPAATTGPGCPQASATPPQGLDKASVYVVERFGRFHKILEPGLAILIPFVDRIRYVQSLKENAVEIPTQSAITQDNVTLEIDGVLYYKIEDANLGVQFDRLRME